MRKSTLADRDFQLCISGYQYNGVRLHDLAYLLYPSSLYYVVSIPISLITSVDAGSFSFQRAFTHVFLRPYLVAISSSSQLGCEAAGKSASYSVHSNPRQTECYYRGIIQCISRFNPIPTLLNIGATMKETASRVTEQGVY